VTSIWTPKYQRPDAIALDKCRASVHDNGRWPSFHQCTRKSVVMRCVDGAEYGFCKLHDPEAVAAKQKAQREKRDQEWKELKDKSDRDTRTAAALKSCRVAMEQIAAGHNDPRTLALETLKLFPS
jgi:hypothetical protein